jgi:hypothetical protein
MCYFITVGVPTEAKDSFLEITPESLDVAAVGNAHVSGAIGSRYTTFALTSGGCSCGLFTSQRAIDPATHLPAQFARRIARYRDAGWSAAKIQRAVDDAEQALRHQGRDWTGLAPKVRQFLAKACDACGQLFVLVHFYHDDLESPVFEIRRGPTLTVDQLLAGDPPVREDELAAIQLTRQKPNSPNPVRHGICAR